MSGYDPRDTLSSSDAYSIFLFLPSLLANAVSIGLRFRAVLARSKLSSASRARWYSGYTDDPDSEGETLMKCCAGCCFRGSHVDRVGTGVGKGFGTISAVVKRCSSIGLMIFLLPVMVVTGAGLVIRSACAMDAR